MTLTKIVLSDIHSRWGKIRTLLRDLGVLDKKDVRQPGFQLIQVGDVVSAGYGMEETDFYRWWVSILENDDIELVGNHEVPILWPYDRRFNFYGYVDGDMGMPGCDPKLRPEILARQHRYKAAWSVGDWLITHAGVYPTWLKSIRSDILVDTAEEMAAHLNKLWGRHFNGSNPLHDSFGCVICSSHNGILWGRGIEAGSKIKQIAGHSPIGPIHSEDGNVWMIDTPRLVPLYGPEGRKDAESWGGVSALVTKDDGESWKLHYIE